jgi:hypothetical protein
VILVPFWRHIYAVFDRQIPMEFMLASQGFFSRFSSGERSFIAAMVGTSIVGAVLACVAVSRLSEKAPASHCEILFTLWTLVTGVVGGVVGLWSTYERWFGYEGIAGWISASIGGMIVTMIGAVVAGTLILPFYGTMFGPLQVIMVMIESPVLAVIWFGMMGCAHRLLRHWRVERDSIFPTERGA